MFYKIIVATIICSLLLCCSKQEPQNNPSEISEIGKNPQKINFPSLDSLKITANLYHISYEQPVIVLCHQAGWNKFEYAGIAEELNKLGFNCLAIDQRAGGPIATMQNETFLEAKSRGMPTTYSDAEQDIVAAVNYASNEYLDKPLILWGSSYSAVLALYIGIDNEKVDAIMAFSPGDYLAESKGSLIPLLETTGKPFFITGAKREAPDFSILANQNNLNENQVLFVPEGRGFHGSRVLWPGQEGAEEYWLAVRKFLQPFIE